MENKNCIVRYFWQVTYAHTIAYFVAGIFAMIFLNYAELFGTGYWAFMRPTNHPLISLGPFLQIPRGIVIALFLLPLRKVFFEEKYGLINLAIITIGLFYVSTFGPGIGSIEGYIYTTIPAKHQIIGIPEMLLYMLLFIGILHISKKYAHKKILTITSILLIVLISFMSIMGFIMAL